MQVLIMYDIGCDKKRRRVEKLLSSHGVRVNYSVFELDVTRSVLDRVVGRLAELTSKEDNIRVYILNKEVIKRSFVLHSDRGVFDEEFYF